MKSFITRLASALLFVAVVNAQEPEDAVARSNQLRQGAFAAEQRGAHEEAAQAFLELCPLEPQDPEWVVRAADNLGKCGRFNDAMDLLEESRKRFPDVLAIPATLARTFHLKADSMRADGVFDANVAFYYQDTIRTAEEVLARDADHLDARLLDASAHYQLGELDEALTQADEAVRRHPKEYGGHAMVGRVAFDRFIKAVQDGDETAQEQWRERATKAFEQARTADRTRAFPVVRLGHIAAWSGEMDRALERYAEALAIDPKADVDHDWLRGQLDAERRTTFYQTALDAYQQQAEATPQGAATIGWYLAQARFDARDFAAAAAHFATALDRIPSFHATWWWLMQSRYWAGDARGAESTAIGFARADPQKFADMIRTDDQTVAIVVGMADTAYRAGRIKDSRDLNLVIAYARQTADAWNNYAFLCRETGAFEDSLRGYEEALRIEPDSPQLLNDAAVILQYHLSSETNLARARQMYERAIELGDEQIAKGELRGPELDRTRTAMRDARMNLEKLR